LAIAAVLLGVATSPFLNGWKDYDSLSNVENGYLEMPHSRHIGNLTPHY